MSAIDFDGSIPNQTARSTPRDRRGWAVVAALGASLLLAHNAPMGSATAAESAVSSLQDPPSSPFNATQQRREMIAQLERIDRRLAQVEATLNKGIKVAVTEIPEITIKNVSDFKD